MIHIICREGILKNKVFTNTQVTFRKYNSISVEYFDILLSKKETKLYGKKTLPS